MSNQFVHSRKYLHPGWHWFRFLLGMWVATHAALAARPPGEKGFEVIANVDDDDRDGTPDCEDEIINGDQDWEDLVRIPISIPWTGMGADSIRVHLSSSDAINTFLRSASGKVELLTSEMLSPTGDFELFVEAKRFLGPDLTEDIELELRLEDTSTGREKTEMLFIRIAPWTAIPASFAAEKMFMGVGTFDTSKTIEEMRKLLTKSQVQVATPYPAPNSTEMWMQDLAEIGSTQIPGRKPMRVAIYSGYRPNSFARSLLAPDFGVLKISTLREPDQWDIWFHGFSNVQVTPPTKNDPLGRVYYGTRRHGLKRYSKEVIDFIESQKVQRPFDVDISWLKVGNVDELVTFISGEDGSGVMLLASPLAASKILGEEGFDSYNQWVQRRMDEVLKRIQEHLDVPPDRILHLPVYFREGRSLWSNPVGCVFIDGTIFCGETLLPKSIKEAIVEAMDSVGVRTEFVPDYPFYKRLGNLHRAIHVSRNPEPIRN